MNKKAADVANIETGFKLEKIIHKIQPTIKNLSEEYGDFHIRLELKNDTIMVEVTPRGETGEEYIGIITETINHEISKALAYGPWNHLAPDRKQNPWGSRKAKAYKAYITKTAREVRPGENVTEDVYENRPGASGIGTSKTPKQIRDAWEAKIDSVRKKLEADGYEFVDAKHIGDGSQKLKVTILYDPAKGVYDEVDLKDGKFFERKRRRRGPGDEERNEEVETVRGYEDDEGF